MASSITIQSSHRTSGIFSVNHSLPPPDHHRTVNAHVSSSFVSMSTHFDVSKWKNWRICSSSSATTTTPLSSPFIKPTIPIHKHYTNNDDDSNDKAAAFVYEKLDKWMENSVVEIVKNLKEAPLLVHVYDKGSDATTNFKTEKSVEEENWGVAVDKWAKKESPMPEGVIFVEQLGKEEAAEEEITRAWGVLVQGKGVECAPVCYLLKTSRVLGSPSGIGGSGVCCTHYYLMRVQSFRESALSQLKNSWLIQG